MPQDVFDEVLRSLKSTGIITYLNGMQELPELNKREIIKLLSVSKKIVLYEDNLCYEDDSGDIICCPELDSHVSDSGIWLSDKVPYPNFNIRQGGNVRKAMEAEACYTCAILMREKFLH